MRKINPDKVVSLRTSPLRIRKERVPTWVFIVIGVGALVYAVILVIQLAPKVPW